jgi:hypothetical protein
VELAGMETLVRATAGRQGKLGAAEKFGSVV